MPIITNKLDLAISDLNQGKPVAIPTETVYGLAAPIDNEEAIKQVYALKNRPLNHPLIVHVAEGFDLLSLVDEIPEYAKLLIQHFWPGPLTLVFQSNMTMINPIITGGQSTVAIRCPAHPLAQELLAQLQVPLVAPSANPFGKVSPTTAIHVQQSFMDKELTILDGGRCEVGIESTIVDATRSEGYQILRHGIIDAQAIAQVCGSQYLDHKNSIRVPGKLASHYQPQKTLYYFESYDRLEQFCDEQEDDVYVIASQKPKTVASNQFHLLAKTTAQAAYDLYFQLRAADESNSACMAIELPPNTIEWQGLRERILKAGLTLE